MERVYESRPAAFPQFCSLRQSSIKGTKDLSIAIGIPCIDLFPTTGFLNEKWIVDELRKVSAGQPPSMALIQERHRLTLNFLRSNGFGHNVDIYDRLLPRDRWRLFPKTTLRQKSACRIESEQRQAEFVSPSGHLNVRLPWPTERYGFFVSAS